MMRLPTDLEIEEMTPRVWDRIEREVFAELDTGPLSIAAPVTGETFVEERSRMRWQPALAMVAVAAAAIWFAAVHTDANIEELRSSRVATGDAPSHVTVPGASLVVGHESALVWSGDSERGVHVTLEKGDVECLVVPREGRPPFVVQAGDVRIEVLGTRFAVAREASTARVDVFEGTVRILAGDETAVVEAGHSWPQRAQQPLPSPTEEQSADAIEELTFRRDVLAPARVRQGARRTQASKGRQAAALVTPPAAQVKAPPPTASERYGLAAQLESSDPEAAIAIYRDLTKHAPEWAANALFAHARLEFERGQLRISRSLLRSYLRRFPHGANAEDARLLLRQLN